MKVAFQDDDSFAFEFVRNLGFIYYGGADLGEMVATAGRITAGDFESWFREWNALGLRVRARADAGLGAGHAVSAREGYLRASTYFRTAEFYLHGDPADPRILSTSRATQLAYAAAARLSGPAWEAVEVPYEGTTLLGYFYRAEGGDGPRPTIVFHGGYDSSVEEMYFFFAAAATRRGYNCLTFDGPGQGAPVREQGLHFRPDSARVVTPAVDYALARPDVDGDHLTLLGMSLGGLLAARAAAFEHRFRSAVFFDGVYDFHDAIRAALPAAAVAAFDAEDPAAGEAAVRKGMGKNTALRCSVEQGLWAFGMPSIAAFFEESKRYTIKDITHQIRCDCLVLEAEADQFFAGQPRRVFDALRSPKTLLTSTGEDGAENHCQSGALAYLHQSVFDWLDERQPA